MTIRHTHFCEGIQIQGKHGTPNKGEGNLPPDHQHHHQTSATKRETKEISGIALEKYNKQNNKTKEIGSWQMI